MKHISKTFIYSDSDMDKRASWPRVQLLYFKYILLVMFYILLRQHLTCRFECEYRSKVRYKRKPATICRVEDIESVFGNKLRQEVENTKANTASVKTFC